MMDMSVGRQSYRELIAQEADFWDAQADEWEKHRSNPICMWHAPEVEEILRGADKRFLVERASSVPGRVLDLGCGTGWLSMSLASKGMEVDAFDISPQLISLAQERCRTEPYVSRCYFYVADLNEITLPHETYVAAVANDALHHILHIEHLLSEISDALKPGGVLVLYDHIGKQSQWNLVLSKLFEFLLPTERSYWHKLRQGLRRYVFKSVSNTDLVHSPFEDVTGMEMLDLIEQYFFIERCETRLAFIADFAARIRMPTRRKLSLVRLLKRFDDWLIGHRLLQGEYVLISAVKR